MGSWGEWYHTPPYPHPHLPLRRLAMSLLPLFPHLPPQESTGPEASGPAEQALESASLAVPPVLEEEVTAHMQPLCIQLGGIKRVYRCQVEGCKEGLSTSYATICAHIWKVHLGVGLVCPLCGKSFFNPDTFRHHKKGLTNLQNGEQHLGTASKWWVGSNSRSIVNVI